MESPEAQLSTEELLQIWSDASEKSVPRREAFWEYWRRVACGQAAFDGAVLEAALQSDVGERGHAMGELAISGVLPAELFPNVRRTLRLTGGDDAIWALNQINAREALNLLASGAPVGRGLAVAALVAKGTSWAAIAAVQHLTTDERQHLLDVEETVGVFTKTQRQRLRDAVRGANGGGA